MYRRPDRPTQALVVLSPACDAWLFANAQAAGLTVAQHGLLRSLSSFLDVSKRKLVEDHPDMIGLLKALRRQPSPAFRLLLDFVKQQLREAGQASW